MIYQSFKKGSEDIETAFFVFTKEGTPLSYFIDNDDLFQNGWVTRAQQLPTTPNAPEIRNFIHSQMASIIAISLFKKYADVETKHLLPGQRSKEILCKYINQTKLPITFLDSKWFTTLVKSDGFKVRGHFRLQPCGENMKDRKLIWINDFEKSGYTAPARKLKEEI
jgi:hypothetical protein